MQASKLANIYDDESHLSRKLLDAKRTRPKPDENRSTVAGLLELADGYDSSQIGVWVLSGWSIVEIIESGLASLSYYH
jgi:hypothetical protein